MSQPTIVDTGPLVAVFDRSQRDHEWAKSQTIGLSPGLLTCEPVLTEAFFLLRRARGGARDLIDFINRGGLVLAFRLADEWAAVAKLMDRYANVPMSLADACLVRMAEQHTNSTVFTLDSDFKIYRKNNRQVVPTIMPAVR
jgi:uncharacterized protein